VGKSTDFLGKTTVGDIFRIGKDDWKWYPHKGLDPSHGNNTHRILNFPQIPQWRRRNMEINRRKMGQVPLIVAEEFLKYDDFIDRYPDLIDDVEEFDIPENEQCVLIGTGRTTG